MGLHPCIPLELQPHCILVYWSSCQWRNWHFLLWWIHFLLVEYWCKISTKDLFSDPRGPTPRRLPLAFHIMEQFSAIKHSCSWKYLLCDVYIWPVIWEWTKIHDQTGPGLRMTVLNTILINVLAGWLSLKLRHDVSTYHLLFICFFVFNFTGSYLNCYYNIPRIIFLLPGHKAVLIIINKHDNLLL